MVEVRQHPRNIAQANTAGAGSQHAARLQESGRQYAASRDQVFEVIQRFATLADAAAGQASAGGTQRNDRSDSTLSGRLRRLFVGVVRK